MPVRLARSLGRAVALGRAADPAAFAVALLVALVTAAVPAAFVLGARALVDDAVRARAGGPTGPVVRDAVLLALAAGAARVIGAVQSHRQAVFAQAVTEHAERGVLRAAAYAAWADFEDPEWHDRLARANRDIAWRPYQLATSAVVLAGALLAAGGIGVALVSVHPLLVVLCLFALLPAVVIQRGVNALLYRFWNDHVPEERQQDYLRDVLLDPAAAKEVRAFGLARWLLERHGAVVAARRRRLRALYARADRRTLLAGVVTAGLLAAAFAYAGRGAAAGRLTPGDVSLVAASLALLTSQLGGLLTSVVDMEQHAAFLDDLFALLAEPLPDAAPANETPPPGGGLRLDAVRFAYPGGPPVLDGLSLAVGEGEVVALVGPSGAGKTTVAKLLLGLHHPDAGTVSVLGRDVREWDPAALRAAVGVVFQDFARFELPLRDCVAIGRADEPPDDARVYDALATAGLSALAERHGLDAPVGRLFTGGHDLSGGEWQRLALARVAYRDPPVWLLDEPTAGLDAETEAALLTRLRARLRGRVALVVSHRLTTTRLADRVAVLEAGRVVEEGTHDALVAAGGRYASYWRLRDADYRGA